MSPVFRGLFFCTQRQQQHGLKIPTLPFGGLFCQNQN
jgi:hypothetical protein